MSGRWIAFALVLLVSSGLAAAQEPDLKTSSDQLDGAAAVFDDAVQAHVERVEKALDARLAEVAAGYGAEDFSSWIEPRLDTLLWLEARARSKASRPAIRSLGQLLTRFEDAASRVEAQPAPDALSLEIQGALRAATSARTKLGGGAISGTVTDQEDGTPLADTVVALRTLGNDLLQTTTTDDSGRYQLTDVMPGHYHVHTQSRTHRNESFNNRPCAPGTYSFLTSICDARYYTVEFSAGHPVGVEAGNTTSGVDFALDPLPKIRGRVVHSETGESRPNAAIEAFLPTAALGVQRAVADFDGYYELTGLRKGHWLVSAFSGPLVGELYEDVPCLQGLSIDCYSQQGTTVFTDYRLPAEGVDFALSPSSSGVEGRVFDDTTGLGIPFALVLIYEPDGEVYFRALADELGRYGAALAPGTYLARVLADLYVSEIYSGVSCGGYECDLESGTQIVADDSGVVTGVDFGLAPGGSISGAVRDTFGNKLFGGVNIYDAEGTLWAQDFTDPDGLYYSATGLAEGSYFAVGGASSSQGWKPQVYREQPCSAFPCPLGSATPIVVTAGQDTGGIDFALESRQTITGHLVDAQSGEPIPFATVSLYSQDGEFLRDVTSDASGLYRHFGIDFSPAYVVAVPEGFVPQIYPGVPCPLQVCDVSLGDGIEILTDGAVRNIDFSLRRGAGIEGRVRLGGEPLAGASVSAYNPQGRLVDTVESDAEGRYRVGGLLDGDYYLTLERLSWVQIYPNEDCRLDCDPLSGEPVSVAGVATSSGVDFNLARRGFISGRITDTFGRPLSGVEVRIREVNLDETISQITGIDGLYAVDHLATGLYKVIAGKTTFSYLSTDPFTIQDPGGRDEVDLQLPHSRGISGRVVSAESGLPVPWAAIDIWDASGELYSQGLTAADGRYSVWVPDGQWYVSTDNGRGGLDKVYPEALCPAGPVIAGACDPRTGDPVAVDAELIEGIDFALEGIDVFDCTPSDTVLCLNGGRFRVETVWRDAQGLGTPGQRGLLTHDSAYFWFFDDDNIEVLVKVLNACGTASNRYWVFAAGLTNVDVSLLVTDTATGRSKEYRNPADTNFQPILDTNAFNSCNVGFQGTESPAFTFEASSARSTADPSIRQAEPEAAPKLNGSCEPGNEQLCLSGNRFQAELTYRVPQSTEQTAPAVQLTDESGYFWFFDARNIEVMVKVLDACYPPFDRFWVFSAGLTNLEVELRVTDTVSGEVRTYTNPANSPFAPIFDISAFDTCG